MSHQQPPARHATEHRPPQRPQRPSERPGAWRRTPASTTASAARPPTPEAAQHPAHARQPCNRRPGQQGRTCGSTTSHRSDRPANRRSGHSADSRASHGRSVHRCAPAHAGSRQPAGGWEQRARWRKNFRKFPRQRAHFPPKKSEKNSQKKARSLRSCLAPVAGFACVQLILPELGGSSRLSDSSGLSGLHGSSLLSGLSGSPGLFFRAEIIFPRGKIPASPRKLFSAGEAGFSSWCAAGAVPAT